MLHSLPHESRSVASTSDALTPRSSVFLRCRDHQHLFLATARCADTSFLALPSPAAWSRRALTLTVTTGVLSTMQIRTNMAVQNCLAKVRCTSLLMKCICGTFFCTTPRSAEGISAVFTSVLHTLRCTSGFALGAAEKKKYFRVF